MRFRKSIRIMKGVRVNFSKSGMSLSAGVRGASINVGSRGTYLNTGIPGTGLYDRQRIGGSSYSNSSSGGSHNTTTEISITVGIDDDGNYFIKDNNGNIITDESLLRKIKRTDAYKNKILELSEQFANNKNLETESFVEIYKKSEKVVTEADIKEQLANLKPQIYTKKDYSGREPDKLAIKSDVESEARRNIRSIAFWTLKKKRAEYFERVFPGKMQREIDLYNENKNKFNVNEELIEKEKNQEYLEAYQSQQIYFQDYINGSKDFVENSIDSFLESMTLPVNFEVSYEYNQDNKILKVDLDLPEIEDLPTSKVTTLSSGKVKLKEKTQKEIKEQYLICVTGLAYFFASHLFNISTNIKELLISAYTQRISKKTGLLNDEYVYSVLFTRDNFTEINIENIVPYLAIEDFKHIINYSKTFDLATIDPMEK